MSIAPITPPTISPELAGITGPRGSGVGSPAAGEAATGVGGVGSVGGIARAPGVPKVDLADSFKAALQEAHGAEHAATDAAERFAKGDPSVGIHEVVIASEKANIEIRYATTLKNKALEAYRELMNTQV